jgi:AcrR family transcriptional regulator
MTVLAHRQHAGKRERAKAQNRADILAAARHVFTEMGYGAASIRDIIRRTTLAAGTFYNYFPDKESIFRTLVEESTRQVRQRVHAARDSAETLEEFVGDAYRAYFEFVAEDRITFELMRRNDAAIRALLGEPALAAAAEELLDDLQVAVERGTVPGVGFDVEYLAAAMYGVAFEVAVRMVERQPVDVDGASRFATTLFLGGIERFRREPAAARRATRARGSS